MKDTRPIEVQVAELSQSQKDTVLKIRKVIDIVSLADLFLMILTAVIFTIKAISSDFDFGKYMLIGVLIIAVLLCLLLAVIAFVKSKYPYYSEEKWKYINQMRKSGSK